MGLHDRISRSGSAAAVDLHLAQVEDDAAPRASDPYAELKTRVHHAVIATLGAELFRQDANQDLSERVLRSVTEQLALDRTPLTREERRQLVREITAELPARRP